MANFLTRQFSLPRAISPAILRPPAGKSTRRVQSGKFMRCSRSWPEFPISTLPLRTIIRQSPSCAKLDPLGLENQISPELDEADKFF
jgi:hypothetical protein